MWFIYTERAQFQNFPVLNCFAYLINGNSNGY